LADFKRNLILERTQVGIAVARAALEAVRRNSRGTTPRPPKAMPANHDIGCIKSDTVSASRGRRSIDALPPHEARYPECCSLQLNQAGGFGVYAVAQMRRTILRQDYSGGKP
jgi:hypothetical protein